MSGPELQSSEVVAAGFAEANRATRLISQLCEQFSGLDSKRILHWFEDAADPDSALLSLVRLSETSGQVVGQLISQEGKLRGVLKLFGSSPALAEYLTTHEDLLVDELPALPPARPAATGEWEAGAESVGDIVAWMRQFSDGTTDGIRRAYWRALLLIAHEDVQATDREEHMPIVARRMSDLVEATLVLAHERACGQVANADCVDLAVIAMGKTGGQELNYVSDVDVIYIYRGRDEREDREHVAISTQLATEIALTCSGPGAEPPLWTLDAGLRPEGRDGALVRSLESCRAYYESWAKNWEFQALMKARYAAGAKDLAREFLELVSPKVWQVSERESFVKDVRDMRATVESNIPLRRAEREIKLGKGGLRDVEFSVQLLQLVHGRTDKTLRVRNTLEALQRLAAGGYIARTDATELAQCYRFLRTVEHQAQLTRMRRTHLMPTAQGELRSIARAISRKKYPRASDLEHRWNHVRDRVRELQQSIFYRPLIEATAKLSSLDIQMHEGAVFDRLSAFGYLDPAGAIRHVRALTQGTSRRATIQKHILPVMLGWLANGADPDQGLLNFRALSDRIGSTHWYLALLRDSDVAARRLCEILPTSTYVVKALMDQPESVKWLDANRMLEPTDPARLAKECSALADRYDYADVAMERVRYVRYREVTRAAMADVTLGIDHRRARTMLTPVTDVAVRTALQIATKQLAPADSGLQVSAVALGRYGGMELTYGSDADVMFVHDPGDLDEGEGQRIAEAVVKHAMKILSELSDSPSIAVDIDLRPEGRNGAITRTVASYVEYWERWASTWERQAMLRARTIDDSDLSRAIRAALDDFIWSRPLSEKECRDIRLLKARMEKERLPRGVKPSFHLKLGPGGLSDVEWLIQIEQLRGGLENQNLRTPSTMLALDELLATSVFSIDEGAVLRDAWTNASDLRSANVLANARTTKMDQLVADRKLARQVAKILGYDASDTDQMIDDRLRLARRARALFEKRFI